MVLTTGKPFNIVHKAGSAESLVFYSANNGIGPDVLTQNAHDATLQSGAPVTSIIGFAASDTAVTPDAHPFYVPGNLITATYDANAVLGPVRLPAETAESDVSSGPGAFVAETSGGITINLIYDSAAMAAPASFRAGIQQAASLLAAAISDQITVNIKIDYSGTGGGAAAGPDSGYYEPYTTVRTDLISNATPGDTIFNSLPNTSSIQGQTQVAVWNAQLKLWGLLPANSTTTDDGSATFATDISSNALVGVALHELTHAMGRVPYGSQPDIFDLFRFTSAGNYLFSGSDPAVAAYFSVNGGNTNLAYYGLNSDPSDFLNVSPNLSDPFDEYYSGITTQTLTALDLKQLDALAIPFNVIDIAVSTERYAKPGERHWLVVFR